MSRGTARFAAQRDENEAEIIDYLVARGASVERLNAKAIPDLLVGYCGVTDLAEVVGPGKWSKNRKRGGLNPDQLVWHQAWSGSRPYVLRDRVEAEEMLQDMERKR